MCELTNGMAGGRHGNGMGAAWARHAMCESAFRPRSHWDRLKQRLYWLNISAPGKETKLLFVTIFSINSTALLPETLSNGTKKEISTLRND
jgi:hypothetical protein